MDEKYLGKILDQFENGEITKEDIFKTLKDFPYIDLGFAKLDTQRMLRRGMEEVIFCKGKTKEHVKNIAKSLLKSNGNIVFTHVDEGLFNVIKEEIPDIFFYEKAEIAALVRRKRKKQREGITVITAGTSDIRVAEESAVIAEIFGNRVERIYDVGIAGLHRLLPYLDILRGSNIVVAVAGMEGALVSVVAGMVSVPIIAVPTSVGYGTNFRGLSTLLSMLNTCVPGIGVVNIDNGFGAGVLAHMINGLAYKGGES